MNEIMAQVAGWFGSVARFVTVLIVTIGVGRSVLTLLREKCGRHSTPYRILRGLPALVCGVYVVNMIARLCSVIMCTEWLAMVVWVLACIMWMIALCRLDRIVFWLSTVPVIVGLCVLWSDDVLVSVVMWYMVCIGVLILIRDTTKTPHLSRDGDNMATTRAGSSKRDCLSGVLRVASLVVAYLAGEYSLTPQVIEHLNDELSQQVTVVKTGKTESKEEESTPIISMDQS